MRTVTSMDADELLSFIQPGDGYFMQPPGWSGEALDEIVNVRLASKRNDDGTGRDDLIEIFGRRTNWTVRPDEQVEVVRL